MSTPGELLEALGREARARFGNGGDAAATRIYRGRSVDELVPQIQRDLGDEAIIVRRREGLTGGVLGFFQHPYIEIEAMAGTPGVDVYDEDASVAPPSPYSHAAAEPSAQEALPAPLPSLVSPAPPASLAPPAATPSPAPTPPPAAPAPPVRPPMLGYAPSPPPGQTPVPGEATSALPPPFFARQPTQPAREGSAYVTAHLAALARADRGDRANVPLPAPRRPIEPFRPIEPLRAAKPLRAAEPRRAAEFEPAPAPAQPWQAGERREVAPGSQGRARAGVARSLQRCGVSEALADELIDAASAHALALAPRAGLAQAVRTTLTQRIPVAAPLPAKGAVIAIVGAGGAGKTSCCSALLGAYRKGSSLPASFATLTRDPSQGELQLLISPHVMKPTAARSPRALRALRRVRGDGVAVLDTPSVSPSDRAGIRELAKLLVELKPERVVVALPATLGAAAAAQLLQALKPLGANALAVTHADETDQLGVAIEAACRFGLAPEYMLDRARGGGWRLRQLEPSALAERLLP
ncbi:MAG TPA: hypothetical protein VK790_03245 [Solirubrobacteraceae bacterium]|jgi:flagellar biosynthesis GTPase FlhF|nr:hypothetical protein [Solirubrobacteraceae bacterium]